MKENAKVLISNKVIYIRKNENNGLYILLNIRILEV